jgi:hypothetical protein
MERSGVILTGKTEVLEENPVSVPFIQLTFNMDCPGIEHGSPQ